MLSPARLTLLIVEFVFLLLGALTIWLGFTNHINFAPGGPGWLVVGVALIVWGLLAFAKTGGAFAGSLARSQKWLRGGSLVLLGVIMLAMTHVHFLYLGKLLALAGLVLLLRGLAGIFLILRQS